MNNLYLFRNTEGKRVRWKFVVDENQTIVSEEPTAPDVTTAARDANGNMVVTSISADDRRILGFFSETTPCWFPGCEGLRVKYNEEVSQLAAGCPACAKGAIIRKYQAIVKKHEAAQSNPTST